MTSDLHAADGSTTKHRRSARRALHNWLLPMFTWLPRELLRVRLLRFVLCAIRYVWFVFILRRLRTTVGTDGVAKTTVAHNLRGMTGLGCREVVAPDLAAGRTGRRRPDRSARSEGAVHWTANRGEIFNLVAHGFLLRNITGLDLITYSPRDPDRRHARDDPSLMPASTARCAGLGHQLQRSTRMSPRRRWPAWLSLADSWRSASSGAARAWRKSPLSAPATLSARPSACLPSMPSWRCSATASTASTIARTTRTSRPTRSATFWLSSGFIALQPEQPWRRGPSSRASHFTSLLQDPPSRCDGVGRIRYVSGSRRHR